MDHFELYLINSHTFNHMLFDAHMFNRKNVFFFINYKKLLNYIIVIFFNNNVIYKNYYSKI